MPHLLITGASSGLGRALALRAAREGWYVTACGRDRERLRELTDLYPQNIGIKEFDTLDRGAFENAWTTAIKDTGPVDIAVLNAGTYLPDEPGGFETIDFAGLINLNLTSTLAAADLAVSSFKKAGGGHLVIVASMSGYVGLPRATVYGATKAALINAAESLRVGCVQWGIKVQLVNPGFIDTPLTRKNDFLMPFLMDVDKAADRMFEGLQSDKFEIVFPRRLAFFMKFAKLMPYWLYFPIVRKVTGF